MWVNICKHDWKIIQSDKTATFALLLLTLFMAIAGFTGNYYAKQRVETIEKIRMAEKASIEEAAQLVDSLYLNNLPFKGNSHRDPTTPGGAANGMGAKYLVLPPSPLMVISVGQSDLYANYYKFGLNKKQALYHEAEILNPTVLFNGYFDPAFVIIYILPLIIIAVCYNVISSEKERGTIKMLVTSGFSTRKLLLIKFIFRFLLMYVFTTLLLFLIMLFSGVNIAAAMGEIGVLLFELIWYMLFWVAVCLAVNLLNLSSGINAAILSGIWLLLLITLPAVLNIMARENYPMPSRLELIAETREASDSARQNMNAMLSGFMEDHPELVPAGSKINPADFAVTSLRTALAVEEAVKPLEKAFITRKEEQEKVLSRLGFVAPGIRLQQVLNRIAGTGEERYHAFRISLEENHEKFRGYFARKIFGGEKMTGEDYKNIPETEFHEYYENSTRSSRDLPAAIFPAIIVSLLVVGLFRNLKEIAAEA